MCAIVGFVSKNPSDEAIKTLKRLFLESKIRGKHAYGFAAKDKNGVTAVKEHNLKALISQIEMPNLLIGHCRYSTSGDYKNHANNQPIQFKDEYMAFNGTIDMRTKPEMENNYNIVMESDNDGEIMLQSKDRMKLLDGNITFAGLFLKGDEITAFRNEHRPAYWAVKHDSLYIASTADIMIRSLLRPIPLTANEVYKWTV